MTRSARSTTAHNHADLDARKRQAIFRATHRGTREMDILMGGFVEAEIASFSDAEMDQLEVLMQAPDWDIYKWVTGTLPVPDNYNTELFKRWVAYEAKNSDALRKL